MSAPLSPIPSTDAMVDPSTAFLISHSWYIWLYEVWTRIRTLVATVGTPLVKANQSAALVAVTVYTVTQTGLYRISYRMRVTTPASVSSSLTMTIGWREGSPSAVTQSQAFAALTGNTTTTQQNGTLFVRADSGTVITESVAYASVGTPMIYNSDVAVELVS